jgi:hypothetical protein
MFSKKVEQRAVIKISVDIGKTPTETHKLLNQSEKYCNVITLLEKRSWYLNNLCKATAVYQE